MGRLEKGKWITDDDYAKVLEEIQPNPSPQSIRHHIKNSPKSPFPPVADRYHLFTCYACPQAQVTLIARKLKGLEKVISTSFVSPFLGQDGWTFKQDFSGMNNETPEGLLLLREFYVMANARYSGRVTVPMLWDKKKKVVVNNECIDIIRMFNSEFNQLTGNSADFYPTQLQKQIDELRSFIYHNIICGVYKTGFASSQSAYEKNCQKLFKALETLDNTLQHQSYLLGSILTEADWLLFAILVRFEAVFYGLFKCSLKRLTEFPNLLDFGRKLYDYPGIKETTKIDHIKAHYFGSYTSLNPSGIIPLGNEQPFPQ